MKEKIKKCCKKLPLEFYIQNYKIIFIFLFPIFGVIYNRIRDKNAKVKNEYFYMELYFISYLFSFIPFLIYIIKYRKKKGQTRNEINVNDDNNEKNEDEKKEGLISLEISKKGKKRVLKGLILIIFLCSTSIAFRHFDYEGNTDKKTIGLVYKIPFLFFLSFLILQYRFHKHHYITLIINLLSLLIKYSLGIIQSNSYQLVPKHLWLYLLFALTHSLFLILVKYYFDNYNITPYFLMIIIGSINSFILIAIATIKYFITLESEIFTGFNNYINSFSSFLLFMADIISQFIYNLGSWITVYYFTPLHTIISENTIEIYFNLYDIKSNSAFWKEQGYAWNTWFIPIVLIINLICSLIFNEMIILKCCKFDYYTRIRINERERKESEIVLKFMVNPSSETDSSIISPVLDDTDSAY